jgi:hypothetical protein
MVFFSELQGASGYAKVKHPRGSIVIIFFSNPHTPGMLIQFYPIFLKNAPKPMTPQYDVFLDFFPA